METSLDLRKDKEIATLQKGKLYHILAAVALFWTSLANDKKKIVYTLFIFFRREYKFNLEVWVTVRNIFTLTNL